MFDVLEAENKHVAALQQQCVKFGVPIPQDTYWGTVTPPATLLEAAETGVLAENLNVAMYDDLLTKVVKYPSLVQVFTKLRAASLNNRTTICLLSKPRLKTAALFLEVAPKLPSAWAQRQS